MYAKDKTHRITLRLTEQQFNFVKANADLMGVSPSDFLRMVVNTSMATTKAALEKRNPIFESLEGLGRENDNSVCNNQL